MPNRAVQLAAIGLGIGLIACVTQDHASVQQARQAFDRCVELHGSRAECDSLNARYLGAQRRYEENSRSAWGCNPVQEQCPSER